MKTLARIIITLAATATFAACTAEPELGTRTLVTKVWEQPQAELAVQWAPDLSMAPDYLLDGDPTSDGELDPGICGCENAACEMAVVEEFYGCNVCVMVECGDRTAGGCRFCGDEGIAAANTATVNQRTW